MFSLSLPVTLKEAQGQLGCLGSHPLFPPSCQVPLPRRETLRKGPSPLLTHGGFSFFLVLQGQHLEMALAKRTIRHNRKPRSNMEPRVTTKGTYHADGEYTFSLRIW